MTTVVTPYSLRGRGLDWLLAIVAMAMSLLAAQQIRRRSVHRLKKAVLLLGLIPALLTSVLFILGLVILFVPGGLLGVGFIVATEADDTIIQTEPIQDGRACIEVHYAGTGAWDSGYGYIKIKKQYWWFPLFERSVWSGKSWSPRDEGPFVEFVGERHLRLSHRSRRQGERRSEPAQVLLRF